jgi:dTDP-4-dehydrorhamnose reductase
MNILVLGASGMAGHVIALYLREKGYIVDTLSSTKRLDSKTTLLNATDLESVKRHLKQNKYNVIINCIALLVTQSEKDKILATQLNTTLPLFLEKYYKDSKTKIIHISTDGIFAGKKDFYIETDIPDGESFYGRTKALGELNNDKDVTFRLSITGPCLDKEGSGLFHWIMNQSGQIKGYTNIHWIGITTVELASAVEQAITQDITGVYHLVSDVGISKIDLLEIFKDEFALENVTIKPVEADNLVVSAVIKNTRKDFDYRVPDYKTMVKNMKSWMESHPDKYAHYAK